MGGSFDPIHWGHLHAAEAARAALNLEEVVFVPAARSPHKREPAAAAEHRYAMAVIATAEHPAFSVSRVELERPEPSFTLDTLRHFRASRLPTPEVAFILGADALCEVETWHRYRELAAECFFVAVNRPGYPLDRSSAELTPGLAARVERVEMPEIGISASEIRRRLAVGQSIRYWTPEGVRAYIAKHGLYREPPAAGG